MNTGNRTTTTHLSTGNYVFYRPGESFNRMTEPEFLASVQRAGPLASDEEAGRVSEAVLAELGRCISRAQAEDLAARLPERFGRALTRVEREEACPEPFERFVESVAAAANLQGDVRGGVRSVMDALADYAGADALSNATAQLPPAYGEVIDSEEVPVTETFTDAVEEASDLDGEEATVAAEATLTTLGERLSQRKAEDVAVYLGGDASEWLVEPQTKDLPVDAFVDRVAARADVPPGRALEYVVEVTDVLGKVSLDHELDIAVDQLPDEYDEVLAIP